MSAMHCMYCGDITLSKHVCSACQDMAERLEAERLEKEKIKMGWHVEQITTKEQQRAWLTEVSKRISGSGFDDAPLIQLIGKRFRITRGYHQCDEIDYHPWVYFKTYFPVVTPGSKWWDEWKVTFLSRNHYQVRALMVREYIEDVIANTISGMMYYQTEKEFWDAINKQYGPWGKKSAECGRCEKCQQCKG